jgi:hypothetical protein
MAALEVDYRNHVNLNIYESLVQFHPENQAFFGECAATK